MKSKCRDIKDVVERSIYFASIKHVYQVDDNGDPYFLHLHGVANIVREVTSDQSIIAAAYLHDTLEDAKTTYTELRENFGERIANLVREVTHEGDQTHGYYFPRLESRDAIMIKFADRLNNISRMESWSDKRRAHYLKRSKFWKSEANT